MDDRGIARGSDKVRASDKDREQVVQRLQLAMQDGRLKMDEYKERMGLAYEAVTYGDLARLEDDLPASTAAPAEQAEQETPTVAVQRIPAAQPAARGFAALPTPLKVLWAIWLVPVLINVVIWVLVSGTSGHLVYPWPVWVAGPFGAVLLGVTAIVQAARSGRRTRR